jgi:hypothetical protein
MGVEMERFELEKPWVEKLLELLQMPSCNLRDPKKVYGDKEETGADVLLEYGCHKIGIQVTELDAGADNPHAGSGTLRADEKRRVAQAAARGHPNAYGGTAPATPLLAIRAAIQKKKTKFFDKSKFNEGWLLISANLNKWGALHSTFVAPQLINKDLLNAHTAELLDQIHFHQVFLHLIVYQTLYCWQPDLGWQVIHQADILSADDPDVQALRRKLFGPS